MEFENIPPVRALGRSLTSRSCRGALLLIAILLAPLLAGRAAAQTPLDARLSIPYSFADPNGLEPTRVLLDHALPLTGWSFGICHDGNILDLSAVLAGSALQDLNGGLGPDFAEHLIEAGGVRSSVVIDTTGSGGVLPPGTARELLELRYVPLPSTTLPSSTTIDFCATLGAPPTPIMVETPLGSLTPVVAGGTVILPSGPPLFVLEIPRTVSTYDLTTGAATVRVVPTLIETTGTGAPVLGFRCGIRHQVGLLEAPNVNIVGPLAGLPPGMGLDLFLVSLAPDGITIEVLIDPLIASTLAFTTEVPIAEIEYEAVGGVLAGVGTPVITPLEFDDTFTPQGVPIVAAVDVGIPVTTATPIGIDGSAILLPSGAFLRGDCNVDGMIDLADPLRTLLHLVQGGSPPCERACDGNDDGREDLADAIFMLGVLFMGNPAPPPPYPTCGLDPTIDALTCFVNPACP